MDVKRYWIILEIALYKFVILLLYYIIINKTKEAKEKTSTWVTKHTLLTWGVQESTETPEVWCKRTIGQQPSP